MNRTVDESNAQLLRVLRYEHNEGVIAEKLGQIAAENISIDTQSLDASHMAFEQLGNSKLEAYSPLTS